MHALLAAGIASGEVVPLPLNRFTRKEAGNAFRFMAAGDGPLSLLAEHAARSPSQVHMRLYGCARLLSRTAAALM